MTVGAGGAMPPPPPHLDFVRSVNPIHIRGADYSCHNTTLTSGFSDPPTVLQKAFFAVLKTTSTKVPRQIVLRICHLSNLWKFEMFCKNISMYMYNSFVIISACYAWAILTKSIKCLFIQSLLKYNNVYVLRTAF